jgi:hypothetical protein
MSQYDTSVTRRGCLHEHSRGSAPCTSNVQIPPMKETQSCIWTSTGFTRQPCRSFKPDSTPPLRQCISDVELSFLRSFRYVSLSTTSSVSPAALPDSSAGPKDGIISTAHCTTRSYHNCFDHRRGLQKPMVACSSVLFGGNAICSVLRDRLCWRHVHRYESY